MPTDHEVEDGECVGSIANENGFFWETLWNHPNNAELKQKRKNPNILLPGDILHIPDLTPKEESRATEQRHRFRVKGVPAIFSVRLLLDNKPRAGVDYQLEVEGKIFTGQTDSNGEVRHGIPPNARKGRLRVKSGKHWEEYALRLGELNPADNVTGTQARLRNMGFDLADEDGELGPCTEAALRAFQKGAGLEVTGRLDEATTDKLTKQHDMGEGPQNTSQSAPAGGKHWEAPDFTASHRSEDMIALTEPAEPATKPDWEDEPVPDDPTV